MKWALVALAVFGYLLADRLPLMQHDSEAVKASRATGRKVTAEPVTLRPAHGYSDSDRKALDRLVARSIREAEKREALTFMRVLYPQEVTEREERIAFSEDETKEKTSKLWGRK